MIAKLSGLIDGLFDGFLILDVNGVGYRVFCSNRTLSMMPSKGERATLFIETQVREDAIHLFGFADLAEKESFLLLTGVQGVGAKVGLAILSALSPNDLSVALATADAKAFTRASGVGAKLASRIVSELKGKSALLSAAGFEMPALTGDVAVASSAVEDAISALVNLGYGRSEAGLVVGAVCAAQKETPSSSELIRLALKEIGKKNG